MPKNDPYDVKANLNKLNKYSDKRSIESTQSTNISQDEGNYSYSSSRNTEDLITSITDYKSLVGSISDLKDTFHSNNEKINEKVSSKIDTLKADFDGKLNEKVDNKYFYAAITVLVGFITLVYTLSYLPLIEEVKNVKGSSEKTQDSINKTNQRLEKHIILSNEKKR